MGNVIVSKCKNCGFSNKFSYGGVKSSYKTDCPVPAINKETLEFENVNYFKHKSSDKYLFYTDDVLKGDNENKQTFNDFNLKLNSINNYCPKCKEKALDFEVTIYTD